MGQTEICSSHYSLCLLMHVVYTKKLSWVSGIWIKKIKSKIILGSFLGTGSLFGDLNKYLEYLFMDH